MKVSIIAFNCSDSLDFIYGKLKESDCEISTCLIGEQTKEKIQEMSDIAERDGELIFYIGGLGGSVKDILKEELSQRYAVNLVYTQKAQEFFIQYAKIEAKSMPPAHIQERLLSFPEGFDCFPNAYGYELAAYGRFMGKEIILLPDNLSECKYIYSQYLYKYFAKKEGKNSQTFTYKVFGLRKDEIEEKLTPFNKKSFKISISVDLSTDAKITIVCNKVSQSTMDEMNAYILNAFKENLYSVDDFSLSQVAVDLLKLYKHRLSVAESLTGGEIAASIVDVVGASDVLFEGCTTYSNQAKQSRLLVKQQTLSQHGAVSHETAYEMGTGLLKTSDCDIVLATTGIAGPGGATETKPVGLTYIAVGDVKGIHIHRFVFSGDRNSVRKKATDTALFLLIKFIKKRK